MKGGHFCIEFVEYKTIIATNIYIYEERKTWLSNITLDKSRAPFLEF